MTRLNRIFYWVSNVVTFNLRPQNIYIAHLYTTGTYWLPLLVFQLDMSHWLPHNPNTIVFSNPGHCQTRFLTYFQSRCNPSHLPEIPKSRWCFLQKRSWLSSAFSSPCHLLFLSYGNLNIPSARLAQSPFLVCDNINRFIIINNTILICYLCTLQQAPIPTRHFHNLRFNLTLTTLTLEYLGTRQLALKFT